MNYLTNYYKNLSEQLQVKLNNLQALLEAYPGGMTDKRYEVLKKAELDRYRPDADAETIARSTRARDLMRRGQATDRRKAQEELDQKHATVSSMPGFHDNVVAAFSSKFANKFAESPRQAESVAKQIAARLHAAGGEGGFKSYADASRAMHDIMQEDETLRTHMETSALEDPMKYGVHHDDIMDVDMSDEVADIHADLDHEVLHSMLPKK